MGQSARETQDKNSTQMELDVHVLITVQQSVFSENSDLKKNLKRLTSIK